MSRDRTEEIRKLEAQYARVDVWAKERKMKIATKIRKLKTEKTKA